MARCRTVAPAISTGRLLRASGAAARNRRRAERPGDPALVTLETLPGPVSNSATLIEGRRYFDDADDGGTIGGAGDQRRVGSPDCPAPESCGSGPRFRSATVDASRRDPGACPAHQERRWEDIALPPSSGRLFRT